MDTADLAVTQVKFLAVPQFQNLWYTLPFPEVLRAVVPYIRITLLSSHPLTGGNPGFDGYRPCFFPVCRVQIYLLKLIPGTDVIQMPVGQHHFIGFLRNIFNDGFQIAAADACINDQRRIPTLDDEDGIQSEFIDGIHISGKLYDNRFWNGHITAPSIHWEKYDEYPNLRSCSGRHAVHRSSSRIFHRPLPHRPP